VLGMLLPQRGWGLMVDGVWTCSGGELGLAKTRYSPGSFIRCADQVTYRAACTRASSLTPHSVPMQPHLGSVVLCLLLHIMVGSKTLLGFYTTCG
jgi:hypothetical protein